ncbi:MAG: cell division protein FtsQ/DivIB [Chloroflexota bacterium]
MRVVRRRQKTLAPRRRRSETRQGYIFEATLHTAARRFDWQPLATLWRAHGGPALSVLLLALVAWGGYVFFATDGFYVYSVAVQGNLAVPEIEILQASGLDGQSIFWVQPERTAEAVAALPDIVSATVTCRLPAMVTIHVVERQAEVLWQWRDRQYWVDSYGVVLQPRGALTDALIVQDSGPVPPSVGGRVDAAAVTAAQQLHALRPQLQAVSYDASLGLVFKSAGGWPVYLGVGDDMALKLAILDALEAELKKQGVQPTYIDLRYPQQPVYR